MTRKYYIVWNGDKSEGFITDSYGAALNADQAVTHHNEGFIGNSTLGLSFVEIYRDDDEEGDYPEITEIEL